MIASLTLSVLLAAPLVPEARYDARIPTLQQLAGHELGDEITSPETISAYLRALAAAAPGRVRLVEYARSEEGRPLSVLVIGSAERIAQLDAIKAGLARLADPRGLSDADAGRLLAELPAVVWLMHAVHGNEISSSDAALALAHHLLAVEGDPAVDLVRREALVLIDPLQNPDGRARFLSTNRLGQGPRPDPEPLAAEHDEPWPGGRSNHYLFDMNRDWFAQSQPETRGRLKLFLEWRPQVAVDLHEMGGDATYFFAPPATPFNPHFSRAQREWLDAFGRAIAERFDAAGQAYFVREVFDSFYPGYGESWPMAQGAIGMTFEQASARGLLWRREDGSELRYLDGVRNHFRATLATVEAAARGREKLLRDFLEFRRASLREGSEGAVRSYVVAPAGDPGRVRRLAELLLAQGVEVRVAGGELRDGARRFAAGSLVVPLAQPAGRLARNLLEPQVAMDEAFVKEQDRRRKKRLPDQIYDVTAWSLPLLFGLEAVGGGAALAGDTKPYDAAAADAVPNAALPAARVAWLLPWGSGTAQATAEALQAGLRLRVADAGFRLGERAWPAGTVIVRVADNPPDAGERLGAILARHHVEAGATDSGYVEEGVSFGSERVHLLKAPRVLLAWDRPTSSQSAGWARWVLERRYGQPVSAVRVSALGRVDLRRFDVVVLPSGDYGEAVGGSVVRKLSDWVSAGGTLVALGEASRWLTREKVGLLATRPELKNGKPETEQAEDDKQGPGRKPDEAPSKEAGDKPKPFDLERAIQPERERPDSVPGALLRVVLDSEHWLSAGSGGRVHAVVEGRRVFTPLKLDAGTNVGLYAARDELVASGLVWDEARCTARAEGVPDAPAEGGGARDRLRRGPELPRLRRGDGAAVRERRAARPGLLAARGRRSGGEPPGLVVDLGLQRLPLGHQLAGLPHQLLVLFGGLAGARPVVVEARRGHLRLELLDGLLLLGDPLLELAEAALHALELTLEHLPFGRGRRGAQPGCQRIRGLGTRRRGRAGLRRRRSARFPGRVSGARGRLSGASRRFHRARGRLAAVAWRASRGRRGSRRPGGHRRGAILLVAVATARDADRQPCRDAGLALLLPVEEVLVAARVERRLAAADLDHLARELVDEVAVVRDEDQRAAVGRQRLEQDLLRVEVEVVRRLVEQQHVRGLEQHLREREPVALAAREHGDLLVDVVAREQEPAEEGADHRAPS